MIWPRPLRTSRRRSSASTGRGVKVDLIAEITSDLNRRLFKQLFEMVAPPTIREAGCLLLMGSEGRGEQTVRTDQDNALLLARDVPAADLARFRDGVFGSTGRVRVSRRVPGTSWFAIRSGRSPWTASSASSRLGFSAAMPRLR